MLGYMGFHHDILIKIRREGHKPAEIHESSAPSLVFPAWVQTGPTPAGPILSGHPPQNGGLHARHSQDSRARNSVDSRRTNDGNIPSTSRENSGNIPQKEGKSNFYDIYPVPQHEIIQVGDILFFSGGPSTMMSIHSTANNKGLVSVAGSADAASLEGDLQFYELVLSESNPYTGHVLSSASFGQHYGCSVIALRRRGQKSECLEYLCVCVLCGALFYFLCAYIS